MARRPVRNPVGDFLGRYSRARLLSWVGVGLGLLVLYALWDLYRDDWPADDSDLTALFDQLKPRDPEATAQLIHLAVEIEQADEQDGLQIDDLLFPHNDETNEELGINWDDLQRQVDQRSALLNRVDLIVDGQEDPQAKPGLEPVSDVFSSVVLIPALYTLARMRLAIRRDDHEAAWREATRLLKLGRLTSSQPDPRITGVIMLMVQISIVQELIYEHFRMLAPDAATTRARTDELRANLITKADLDYFYIGEYQRHHDDLDAYRSNLAKEYGILQSVYFKPNRYVNELVDRIREARRNFGRPLREFSFPLETEHIARWENSQKFIFIPNSTGQQAHGHGIYHKFLVGAVISNSRLQLARLGLALAGYANEHEGRLPEKLEALAPAYLDAVPLDPVTHRPFHYDPATGRVWSVGENLKDEGGKDKSVGGDDLVIKVFGSDEDQASEGAGKIPKKSPWK